MSRARKEVLLNPEVPSDILAYLKYAQQLMADVPEEDWADVPADLARNHEHYLYGSPKQEQ
jgi:hypothetical protein